MKRYITIILIGLSSLLWQGCSHFDDLNKSTYTVYEVSPASLIQTITFYTQSRNLSISYSLTSQLVQHAISITTSESAVLLYNYDCTSSHAAEFWELYTHKANAEAMLDEARKINDPGLEAVALVLRTYIMQEITDAYGDVPYFQAGLMPVQPENKETNLKYDSQKEIYRDMCLTLEKANTLFQDEKAADFTAVFDNTYGGKIASWRKLGNTLYLRLLMRMSLKVIEEDGGMIDLGEEYGQFDVRSKIAEIYDGFINDNGNYPILRTLDDRAMVHFNTANSAYYTPFYTQTYTLFKTIAACETIVTAMTPKNGEGQTLIDPRFYYYFSKPLGLPVHMFPNEVDEFLDAHKTSLGNSSVGRYAHGSDGCGNLKDATSYAFMNYSEPLFIFAEACAREWIPGGSGIAKQLYLDACEASMIEWNPTDHNPTNVPAREVYLDFLDETYDYDKALETIMTQKWIASFWYGVEAWSDYRRTGYPILRTDGPAAKNNHILCTRMQYPYTEPYHNGKCYWEAVNGWLGGEDNMQTDVWWADTPESKSIRRKGRQ